MRLGALLVALLLIMTPLAGCRPLDEVGSRYDKVRLGRAAAVGTAWLTRSNLRWQWQLTGPLDLTVDADVYTLDAFTTTAADVAVLHSAKRLVICHFNAGISEDFRPDSGRFPEAVKGAPAARAGERWLDIRRWDVLRPILADRMRMCKDKGFDAVEPDHVDGYLYRTGFPLTDRDQLAFNLRLAALAHSLGLAVALTNDLPQVAELEPAFDFAVNEECFRLGTCAALTPFITAGKAVFHVEYEVATDTFCPQARLYGFASMRKRSTLDAWRETC